MNIYVGNLGYSVTEDDLRAAFEAFGTVDTVSIIKDKFSGQSKGFGFVEMASGEEAQAAIASLNGKDFKGRSVVVNEARPRAEGGGGGGGGGRGWFFCRLDRLVDRLLDSCQLPVRVRPPVRGPDPMHDPSQSFQDAQSQEIADTGGAAAVIIRPVALDSQQVLPRPVGVHDCQINAIV